MDARRLTGKTAVVTAAGRGIGRAIAQRLAEEGAHVLAIDRDAEPLTDIGPGIENAAIDATNPVALAAAIGERPVDILVNAVGWVAQGTVLQTSPDDWRTSFHVNVDAAYHAIRHVLPGMLERRSGSVITISSAASSVGGFPNRVAYTASKAALIGMTKAMAADHIRDGVRFNAIAPGTVDSPSLRDRVNAANDPVAARAAFIARQPMGRLGEASEIAALAAYLAADESAFMTGQVVVIDGGATL